VLSDEDRALFQAAVTGTQPLRVDRVHHDPPHPPPVARQRQRDEAAALVESIRDPAPLDIQLEGGDELAFIQGNLPRMLLRDLRRGRWVVQDQLDLHGATRDSARMMLADFLGRCLVRGVRCVRIIHGKGLRSPGREPVLKSLTAGWLGARQEVLAFCQARANDGGAGAVVVLLASATRKRRA
jgi:DNA-nicking Smr family endonuclease